ncbi:MAG: hypothetical protein AAF288_09725 [Planctomycetota bacterium]
MADDPRTDGPERGPHADVDLSGSLPPELAQRLGAHYRSQHASDDLKRRVASAVEHPSAGPPDRPRRKRAFAPWLAVAAAVGIGLTTWLTVSHLSGQAKQREIAIEIALNHRKAFAPDVETADLRSLAAQMPKLDFTPVQAVHPSAAGLTLVGARYCSIDGAVAAQLRFIDAENRTCTMYQVRADRLPKVERQRFNIDGTQVELWREGDVLLGLARSPAGS